MAYEWIKIEVVTPDKPEIYQLAEILALDPDAVLGKLVRVWAWADQQTIDGNANSNAASVTKSAIDRIGFMHGLADALIQVGWLRFDGSVLVFPNFERHNGKSSKKRLLTNRRVTEHREKTNKSNVRSVTPAFQKALPEEEIELEEVKDKNTMSDSDRTSGDPDFEDLPAQAELEPASDDDMHPDKPDPVSEAFENIFWGAGLRKDAKVKARTAFGTKFRAWRAVSKGTPGEFASMLAQDIKSRLAVQQLGIDRMLPTSYLNGERWNDQLTSEQTQTQRGFGGATRPYAYQDTESSEVFLNFDALRSDSGGRRS